MSDGNFVESGMPLATMQNVAHWSHYSGEEGRQIMAMTTLFTCLCGVQKKTSNHWVLAKQTARGITFMPWDISLAMSSDVVVLCGEGCAAALLSRSLGDWKKPAVSEAIEEKELAAA
jgi:hypothetical protein